MLIDFLQRAQLDAIGVFGYPTNRAPKQPPSDHVDADEIDLRVEALASVAEDVMSARAAAGIGESVRVLVRLARRSSRVRRTGPPSCWVRLRDLVAVARIVASEGADLIAEIVS